MRSLPNRLLLILLVSLFLSPAIFAQDNIADLTRRSNQGEAAAQVRLAYDYEKGAGVPQDFSTAAYWYRKSADQGNPTAETNLGVFYRDGTAVPQDYNQAVALFRKAANQGDNGGETNLGWMYEKGNGVPQDYSQAIYWYRLGAAQNNTFAENTLGIFYEKGLGVSQDYNQAAFWYRKGADQGFMYSEYNMGLLYAYGKGLPQDKVEAAKWFKLAAAQGDTDAQAELAKLQNNSATDTPTTPIGNTSFTPGSPISLAELEGFLRSGIPLKSTLTLVKAYGVNFGLSESLKSELSQLGATTDLLLAVASGRKY